MGEGSLLIRATAQIQTSIFLPG